MDYRVNYEHSLKNRLDEFIAHVPVPVIDRKLPPSDFLDFAQGYHALHPQPQRQEDAR